MKKFALALVFVAGFFSTAARADDGLTAIVVIDGSTAAIPVDDLDACYRAINNHVSGLRMLYQNNYTVTSVVGECFDRAGRLLSAGRCGVKPQSGQITTLCVPQMQDIPK